MPNPKDFMEKDAVYVKSHVRWIIGIFLVVIVLMFFGHTLLKLGIIALCIGVPVFLLIWWFRKHKRVNQINKGNFYTITRKCPNCHKKGLYERSSGSYGTGRETYCRYCKDTRQVFR
jgi:hypothetical protein